MGLLEILYDHLKSQDYEPGIDCVLSARGACIIIYNDRGHYCCTIETSDVITVGVLGDHYERFDLADPRCIEMLHECINRKKLASKYKRLRT